VAHALHQCLKFLTADTERLCMKTEHNIDGRSFWETS
jgi:hypothetical protein